MAAAGALRAMRTVPGVRRGRRWGAASVSGSALDPFDSLCRRENRYALIAFEREQIRVAGDNGISLSDKRAGVEPK